MNRKALIFIIVATGLFSCGQVIKSTPDTVDKATLNSTENVQGQKQLTNHKETFIYTQYAYTDPAGMRLIIQNSFPKGGMRYTDANGAVYVYAVFWTRLINETNNPLELKIEFPVNSYEAPSLPGKYFEILLPSDTMTLDKESLFNHGLTDLGSFLDNSIHKPSSLNRIINPKGSGGFYVVMLCLIEGAQGVLRTGLSLKEQDLFYSINGKEIHCGKINLKNMALQQ